VASGGVTFILAERTANTFLFASLYGNPVDLVPGVARLGPWSTFHRPPG